jgi:hypothetical protein
MGPLERRAALRLSRKLRRPISALAAITMIGGLGLAALGIDGSQGGVAAPRVESMLVWTEFLLVVLLTTVAGGASIADERWRGTWDGVCMSDLSNGEIAWGKLLGALWTPVLIVAVAVPAHILLAWNRPTTWGAIAGVHVVLTGTIAAVSGLAVLSSAWTNRALQGVAFAAAAVLFPWFGLLDGLTKWRIAPTMCQTLHPVRHLEWLLAADSHPETQSIAVRGASFLIFTVVVAGCATKAAARRVRRSGASATLRLGNWSKRRPARKIGNNPVFWRECHEPGGRRILALIGAAVSIMLLAMGVKSWNPASPEIAFGLLDSINGYLATLALAAGMATGVRGAVTLADERARDTLEPLWLAGIEPAELVRSKLGAIFRPILPIVPLFGILACLGYCKRIDGLIEWPVWFAIAEAVAIAFVHPFLAAGLSLAASAHASSTRGALFLGMASLIGLDLGTLIAGVGLSPFLPESISQFLVVASPIYQVSVMATHATRFPATVSVSMLLGVLATEFAIGLAAVGLAMVRMERELPPAVRGMEISRAKP